MVDFNESDMLKAVMKERIHCYVLKKKIYTKKISSVAYNKYVYKAVLSWN